jgi:hypothetical protein
MKLEWWGAPLIEDNKYQGKGPVDDDDDDDDNEDNDEMIRSMRSA